MTLSNLRLPVKSVTDSDTARYAGPATPHPLHQNSRVDNPEPGISVIIPAYREAPVIGPTLAHVRSLAGSGSAELIVADGHPDCDTLDSLGTADADVIRLKTRRGRGRQMNAGAAAASGKLLLFLHSDTRLPPTAFQDILRVMRDGSVVGGAFDLGIDSERRAYRLIEAMVRIRTRLTRIPYGDQAIFLDRGFFQRIGGFGKMPLMEDVELMRRVRRLGRQIAIIPHPVHTSPRRWEKEGLVRCTLRNWALITLYLMGTDPEKLARFYR